MKFYYKFNEMHDDFIMIFDKNILNLFFLDICIKHKRLLECQGYFFATWDYGYITKLRGGGKLKRLTDSNEL
jgi:hypothetical protein